MTKKTSDLKKSAEVLQKIFTKNEIPCTVTQSKGQCGGGAFAGKKINRALL
ncbi:MAG: hypothetical protein R2764_00335 [Bacteroidales bacterium]